MSAPDNEQDLLDDLRFALENAQRVTQEAEMVGDYGATLYGLTIITQLQEKIYLVAGAIMASERVKAALAVKPPEPMGVLS